MDRTDDNSNTLDKRDKESSEGEGAGKSSSQACNPRTAYDSPFLANPTELKLPPDDIQEMQSDSGNEQMTEQDLIDRRKNPRTTFSYPAEFRLISPGTEQSYYRGFLQDLSLSGVCMEIEDRYGRLDLTNLPDAKIKIRVCTPQGETITLPSVIKWAKKQREQKFIIQMGIEFNSVEEWQLEGIRKLIILKNQDRNMMWNLLEQYENKS